MTKEQPRLYAIGDIHGHLNELIDLVAVMVHDGMDPDRDTVVFLGDYVDSGPHSRQVIHALREWQNQYPHWVFLRGNHDQMWLDAFDNLGGPTLSNPHWFYQGGMATWDSYDSPVMFGFRRTEWRSDREWIESLPLIHETERHIFVHAGLRPGVALQDASDDDCLWIRDEFIQSDYDFGKVVVFGHTCLNDDSPYLSRDNRRIGINTMPRNAGRLTAVDLTGPRPKFLFNRPVVGQFAT